MSSISEKIKTVFPSLAVLKNDETNRVFAGRNLPSFIKDYIIQRFSEQDGIINLEGIQEYLETKMSVNGGEIRRMLLDGKPVNITCRFIVESNLKDGQTWFRLAETDLGADAFILPSILEEHKDDLVDGENWGNITLEYVEPQGRRKGFVNMTAFRPFHPYSIDHNYFLNARSEFTTEEWIDLLIAAMQYDPDSMGEPGTAETLQRKLEFISRLLIFVEPRLNIIELGPKGTGKSFVYSNLSKYVWLLGSGSTTRARMFYNRATKQFGYLKSHDAVLIDEISTFETGSRDGELQSMLKGYLEAGKASVDGITFESNCGLGLVGNINLSRDLKPTGNDFYKTLPGIFRESATLDRFHGFIEGWLLPRLGTANIHFGWTLNVEYFSELLHYLRTQTCYEAIFNRLVKTEDGNPDIRDVNAVRKLATAACKLLFPHIRDLDALNPEDLDQFKLMYRVYCLEPAVKRRGIIRAQCHMIDKEYKAEMPEFVVE
jgi:ATP-dependent Lon protease